MTDHPYTNLPTQAFWKTAVAEVEAARIDLGWQPKAPVTRDTKIITVGSCFAQHISKSLKENGFRWLDSEPAPAELPATEHAKQGYGVFSFRTGNIYTAALLKQWICWATGRAEQSTEHFLDDGRYYDPFRPSLNVQGFASAEQMLQARRTTLEAILGAVRQADLFIFTLGLTEAWRNKDGTVYSMCPGTIRGKFSPDDHLFHNYCNREVERDLTETFDELRRINPNLRFLLTVSPVPLTATASGQHVLTATTYSKSVLRSAAGHLAASRDDVDYFPSYELITAPPFEGRFYEPNMRSVSPKGVAFVMAQFLGAIGALDKAEIEVGARTAIQASSAKSDSDDICDDIILESWANRAVDESEEPPNILLIGDSQMGMIAKVLEEQGIRYAGGAIMHASQWYTSQFSLDDKCVFKPWPSNAKRRWDAAFETAMSKWAQSGPDNRYVITNLGMHSSAFLTKEIGIFGSPYIKTDENGCAAMTAQDIVRYLEGITEDLFGVMKTLVATGYRVIWLSDPPVYSANVLEMLSFVEHYLGGRVEELGCSAFLSGEWIKGIGGLKPEFRSRDIDPKTGEPDIHHGSTEYYRQLVKEIFSRYAIQPQFRQT